MALHIGLHMSHLPDGSELEIRQRSCNRLSADDPFVIALSVVRTRGASSAQLRGTITVPNETLTALPDSTDDEKSRVIERALAAWFDGHGLSADFDLGAVIDPTNGIRLTAL